MPGEVFRCIAKCTALPLWPGKWGVRELSHSVREGESLPCSQYITLSKNSLDRTETSGQVAPKTGFKVWLSGKKTTEEWL